MSDWQPESVTLTTDHFTHVKAGDKIRLGKRGTHSSLPEQQHWGALVPLHSDTYGPEPVAYIHEIAFPDYFAEIVTYIGDPGRV